MKAITLLRYGNADVLQLSEVSKPTPSAQQLLIKVHATALNRADILQRQGKYPPPPGESEILGLEIAGEVVCLGSEVTGFKQGQRVFGLVGGGGYAEFCLLDHQMAMLVPQHWSYAQAAAVPEVFFTANEAIFELGQLQGKETILIHAGGSGVGTAGIQMASHLGACVYITAGSQSKIDKAIALGARAGFNYKLDDFADKILDLTHGLGVDVVIDFIGANYLSRNLAILKEGGRLIQVAVMSGRLAEIDLSLLMNKLVQIKGFIMRRRHLEQKRNITKRFKQRWLTLLKDGKIRPIIDSIFPITQIQDAHRYLEASKHFGKVVIDLQQSNCFS